MRSYFVSRLARWCVGVAVALSLMVVAGSARARATTNIKTGNASDLAVQSGPATQLAVVQEPTTATAGAVIAPHFKVQLRDAERQIDTARSQLA